MTSYDWLIIAVLAALQVKHFLFDFVLQRPYEFFRNKGIYGHPGGIVHAGLHAIGTIPALLIMPPTFAIGAAIVVVEFLVHYHIDWGKEQIDRRWKTSEANHFLLLGLDQLAHQMTYVAILAALLSAT